MFDVNRDELVSFFYSDSAALDAALAVEKFLCETAIVYPYKGWAKGEVVGGPRIGRHYVSIALYYPYFDMPDPRGAKILRRFGCGVKYRKTFENVSALSLSPRRREHLAKILNISIDELSEESDQNTMFQIPCWIVYLHIPRDVLEVAVAATAPKYLEQDQADDLGIDDEFTDEDEFMRQ
jgi:hypothetical protein